MAAIAVMSMMLEEEEEFEEEEELITTTAVAISANQTARGRRWWMHSLNEQRSLEGVCNRLMKELEMDNERFKNYFRLSKEQFYVLLCKIDHALTKETTRLRHPISSRERLAVTLRYLATGDSFVSLSYAYRIADCTIGAIVNDVCTAIWEALQPEAMKAPATAEDWKQIAEDFESIWQFPNCCGAIDGKHIVLKAPPMSAAVYYNYKGTFSIVLLAVVDANYRVLIIDVGSCGMNNDSGVFRNSRFGQALRNGTLPLPADRSLPGAEVLGPLPYVFVADEGMEGVVAKRQD
ncbi:protein ANTAGONIST OF LIKE HETEROCHROMATIN PROTEIN 1-like [Haliotis rubra]|uniref:protein ANTAGONIST OF LIKE HETEROCHROMATIN PROTEIN 1-like n=1 Tax=Haliotis rubra TaxID=36100 RepID=UPI001EE5246A|nr:protein ANTAGONIST OF LIKE HETEROCHROMATIN PROTEIN 1-like [Haliotis rubra]